MRRIREKAYICRINANTMKKFLYAIAFFLLVSCAGKDADVRVITDFYKAVLGQGWYRVSYTDMGTPGTTDVQLKGGKIVDYRPFREAGDAE